MPCCIMGQQATCVHKALHDVRIRKVLIFGILNVELGREPPIVCRELSASRLLQMLCCTDLECATIEYHEQKYIQYIYIEIVEVWLRGSDAFRS